MEKEKVDLEVYQKWNKEYDNLYNKVDLKSKELNDYLKDKKDSSGLVSDEIRKDKEYLRLDKEFKLSDYEFKFYHKNSPKEYLKQRSNEQKAKRRNR